MSIRKAFVIGAIFIGVGAAAWAAQQVWRSFLVHETESPAQVYPDGSVGVSRSMTVVSSDDPEFTQEKAEEQWAAMKDAIVAGQYSLRETNVVDGLRVYHYDITLHDGRIVGFGSSIPIEEIEIH